MISQKTKAARLAFALMAGAAVFGAGSAAAQVSSYREDPGTALTRHLRSLSDNPRSLHALMGAAQAALELGDPQAAITFFARAEEVAPRDPRIKAGFGSAFLQMEKAPEALKFFNDARILGIAESEIASDRGLAHDLMGDPARAQSDYQLALRHKDDPEVRRRLALSLAISGDKAGAIATIDRQLQRQDRAAWRTRAFVLALTGDTAGATKAVQAVMPATAAAMQPFLARLPSLDPAGKAMAVHFGHFPGGVPVQVASNTQYAGLAPASTTAGRPDGAQPVLGRRTPPPEPVSTAARRRPGDAAPRIETASRTAADETPRRRRESGMPLMAPTPERRQRTVEARPIVTRPAPPQQAPTQLALAAPTPAPPVRQAPATMEARPVSPPSTGSTAQADTPPAAASSPIVRELFGPPAPGSAGTATASAPIQPAPAIQTVALPESTIEVPEAEPEETAEAAPAPPAADKPRKALDFAEVVEAVKALPEADKADRKPVQLASARIGSVRTVAPKAAAAGESADKEPKAGEAGRHWVQIASAPDDLVTAEYRRLKRKHASLLSDKDGYRAPMGRSNRVLVGPFASAGEARDFVGELKKNSLTAIAWSSQDGQEIEKLQAK